nr:DUF664 domain-containing protein [Frankia sp. Cas3]
MVAPAEASSRHPTSTDPEGVPPRRRQRIPAAVFTVLAVLVGVVERPQLLAGFFICALLFIPLEQLLPLVRRRRREDWYVDVAHTFANRLPITVVSTAVLTVLAPAVHHACPQAVRELLLRQPGWCQFIIILLLADLANYAAHRALHELPPLWRLHAVHHSSRELDWLSTSRGHPLDQIVNLTAIVLPLYAVGFDLTFSSLFVAFQFYFPFLAHANTRLTLRPLSVVFVTPAFHHWHHADTPEAVNRNYGAVFSFWDTLLGTRYLPAGTPPAYGIPQDMAPSWAGQLVAPFRPRRTGVSKLSDVVATVPCVVTPMEGDTVTRTDRAVTSERADLLETLAKHRYFLRYTVRDLTDDQAAQRTTVSELCLGGLIKHVAFTERGWIAFIIEGPSAMEQSPAKLTERSEAFRMLAGESLPGLLDEYEQVARRTDELVVALPDLDVSQPLPEAPWFEPGARWSARRVLLHVIAETAQHAGHADIIREALDGATSMG